MISFELLPNTGSENPDTLEVYFDKAGLNSLIAQLRFINERRTDHVHLMAESWGGNHLDELTQVPNQIPIRHVKMILKE